MESTAGGTDTAGFTWVVAAFAFAMIGCSTRGVLLVVDELIAALTPGFCVGRSLATDRGTSAAGGAAAFAVFTETTLAAAPGEEPMVSVSQTIETAVSTAFPCTSTVVD